MKIAALVSLTTQTTRSDTVTSSPSIMFRDRSSLRLIDDHGWVTTELLQLGGAGMAIGRVTSTGHEIELQENEHMTFLLPVAGRLDIAIGDRHYSVPSGRASVFLPADRRTIARDSPRSRFRATTLQVPMRRIHALAADCEASVETCFDREGAILSGRLAQALSAHLPRLVDDIFLVPSVALSARVAGEIENFVDERLCELLTGITSLSASRPFLPAFHRVRQAEEVMHAHSHDPLSMRELAQSLGISLRSLQLAFQEVHGYGPREALNRIRLEKARQRLLTARGEGRVTEIALESGFSHLSRFAQSYAQAFGERPSETLMRRRA